MRAVCLCLVLALLGVYGCGGDGDGDGLTTSRLVEKYLGSDFYKPSCSERDDPKAEQEAMDQAISQSKLTDHPDQIAPLGFYDPSTSNWVQLFDCRIDEAQPRGYPQKDVDDVLVFLDEHANGVQIARQRDGKILRWAEISRCGTGRHSPGCLEAPGF